MNDSLKTCNLYHLTGQVCTQRGVPLMSARHQRYITLCKQINYNKRGGKTSSLSKRRQTRPHQHKVRYMHIFDETTYHVACG